MLALLIGVSLSVGFSAPAGAGTISLFADINSAQAVPGNTSEGVGSAAMLFDDVTLEIEWAILFRGLTGPATLAHFHRAPVGVPGPVVLDIGAVSGLGEPDGSGLLTGSGLVAAEEVANLLRGDWYINIHTEANPAGEIRGQVLNSTTHVPPVPEPAIGWLFLAGTAALVCRRRRESD
jgi:hypothetical protein